MNKHPRVGWFITIPLAAVTAAYVAFAFFPAERAIGRVRADTIQMQEHRTLTGNLASVLETANGRLEKAAAFNQRWSSTAPKRREVSGLLGKIDSLVRASGSRTTRFDPEPIFRRQRISELPLTVGCVGTFQQVFAFLHGLESLPQTIWIKNLQIGKDDKTGDRVTCEANLVIFMDNSEISDQVDLSEQPIREETVRSR